VDESEAAGEEPPTSALPLPPAVPAYGYPQPVPAASVGEGYFRMPPQGPQFIGR
jgi:hypothetical protein